LREGFSKNVNLMYRVSVKSHNQRSRVHKEEESKTTQKGGLLEKERMYERGLSEKTQPRGKLNYNAKRGRGRLNTGKPLVGGEGGSGSKGRHPGRLAQEWGGGVGKHSNPWQGVKRAPLKGQKKIWKTEYGRKCANRKKKASTCHAASVGDSQKKKSGGGRDSKSKK